MKIVIIIPAYNEEQTIAATIEDFYHAAPSSEIIVVDNNSKDVTFDIATTTLQKLRAAGRVIIERQQGKSNAVRRAFMDVDADIYIMVDADCTYSAADLKKLLEPVLSGSADMVVGDRHATGDYAKENRRRFHNFGNELVCQLINRAFGSRLNDILSGYRVFSGRFVKNFPILSAGFELETELTLHALDKRFRILEIPISYRDRPVGSESKLNTFRDGFRVVRTIFSILRFNRPFLFFGATALLFGFAGVLVGSTPVIEFYETKRILHLPSAILATGLMSAV